MTELIRLHITAATEEEATKVARTLLEQKLVACVQVHGPVASHYCWDGKLEESREWACTMKTTAPAFDAVQAAIRAVHSYDVPQIVATPIVNATEDYAQWVVDSVVLP